MINFNLVVDGMKNVEVKPRLLCQDNFKVSRVIDVIVATELCLRRFRVVSDLRRVILRMVREAMELAVCHECKNIAVSEISPSYYDDVDSISLKMVIPLCSNRCLLFTKVLDSYCKCVKCKIHFRPFNYEQKKQFYSTQPGVFLCNKCYEPIFIREGSPAPLFEGEGVKSALFFSSMLGDHGYTIWKERCHIRPPHPLLGCRKDQNGRLGETDAFQYNQSALAMIQRGYKIITSIDESGERGKSYITMWIKSVAEAQEGQLKKLKV